MNYKRWSDVDTKYLIKNVNHKPLRCVADDLGRTYASIMGKVTRLKLQQTDYVKKGWATIKEHVNDMGVYDMDDTINKLGYNDTYINFMGRSGNRKLMSCDGLLYNSVYQHTKSLDKLKDKNSKSIMARIIFLVKHGGNIDKIKCECGNGVTYKQKQSVYVDYVNNFQPFCIQCQPKYPSEKYFKFKYGDDWMSHRDKRRDKLGNTKTNSKEWFQNKYGTEWEGKYLKYYNKKMVTLHKNTNKLFKDTFSKISQELFNDVVGGINVTENIYYATNGGEFFINLRDSDKIKLGKHCIKPDFKVGNKIIEFEGDYWHNKTIDSDNLRYKLLDDLGYKVMVVSEGDYRKNKDLMVNKCINFIHGK